MNTLKNLKARFKRKSNLKKVADMRSATSVTINELRTAFAVQQLLEKSNKGETK